VGEVVEVTETVQTEALVAVLMAQTLPGLGIRHLLHHLKEIMVV
jgi:hypothetical protein